MAETTQKAQVLLIDDEEAIRETMRPVLEDAGYGVYCAANGADALAASKKLYFDILLVDYTLPDTDGLKLIKDILAVSKDSIPLIVSGASSIEIAVEGMRIGAHDYLVKPVDMNDLLKILAGILSEREEYKRGKANVAQVVKKLDSAPESELVVIAAPQRGITADAKKNIFRNIRGTVAGMIGRSKGR
jgi:DNA-binding NtrC family response regulator